MHKMTVLFLPFGAKSSVDLICFSAATQRQLLMRDDLLLQCRNIWCVQYFSTI